MHRHRRRHNIPLETGHFRVLQDYFELTTIKKKKEKPSAFSLFAQKQDINLQMSSPFSLYQKGQKLTTTLDPHQPGNGTRGIYVTSFSLYLPLASHNLQPQELKILLLCLVSSLKFIVPLLRCYVYPSSHQSWSYSSLSTPMYKHNFSLSFSC